MSSKSDARFVRSREALHNAFLALLEDRPLEGITIREICAKAGVHYATFFRHHPSKKSLLEDIAAKQIEHLVTLALPVVESEDGHAVHLALCNYVNEHRRLWTTLLTGGAAGTLKAELLRLCVGPAKRRVPKNVGIPVELIVISTVTVLLEALSWWLTQPRNRISVEQFSAMLDQLVYSSFK